MQRVHRKLSRADVEALRTRLTELVPMRRSSIPEVLRVMRLITRKSQAEYARMCGVSPRVLAAIEGGTSSPTVDTLEKLLRPFGYRLGVVMDPPDNGTRSTLDDAHGERPQTESALARALRKSRNDKG